MATFNPDQLAELRQRIATDLATVNFTKPQINAALQAVETWFEKPSIKASLKADVDAATAPFAFTGAQIAKLVKYWLTYKFKVS